MERQCGALTDRQRERRVEAWGGNIAWPVRVRGETFWRILADGLKVNPDRQTEPAQEESQTKKCHFVSGVGGKQLKMHRHRQRATQ